MYTTVSLVLYVPGYVHRTVIELWTQQGACIIIHIALVPLSLLSHTVVTGSVCGIRIHTTELCSTRVQ